MVRCVQEHAVVAPAVAARERVDGQELHRVHPEVDEVVEAVRDAVERAGVGVGAGGGGGRDD